MIDRNRLGKYQEAIGSTDAWVKNYFYGDLTKDTERMTGENDADTNIYVESQIVDDISNITMEDHIDLYDIMVGDSHSRTYKGIYAEHLEFFLRIDNVMAKNALNITSQHSIQKD